MDEQNLFQIEQKLFTLKKHRNKEPDFTVEFVVDNIGAWIIKSRKDGVLVNDKYRAIIFICVL